MSTDVFSNFGPLDELIQVIYQSAHKFVVLSTVSDDDWTIRVGLSTSEGRWWKGSWTEADVHKLLSPKASDRILEQFAEKVAELLIGGELYVNNVNPSPAKQMTFTIGPATKKPVNIELTEIPPEEAAAYATTVFLDIAIQAQSRKGRLHGTSIPYPGLPSTSTSHPVRPSPAVEPLSSTTNKASASKSATTVASTSSHLDSSKTTLPKATSDPKKRPAAAPPQSRKLFDMYLLVDWAHLLEEVPLARPHKGVSLANPNKKARKYEAVQFESDED